MDCPACGAANREGARFCRACGGELVVDEGQASAEVSAALGGEAAGGAGSAGPEVPEEAPAEGGIPSTEAAVPPAAEPCGEGEEVTAEAGAATDTLVAEPESEVELTAEAEGTGVVPEQIGSAVGQEGKAEPLAPEEERVSLSGDEGEFVEDELLPEAGDELLAFWREGAEPMVPVEPGTVVGDRFAIIEALDVQDDQILYRAKDLQRCWQCGFEGNDAEGVFCARCGVLMDHRPDVRLMQVREPELEPATNLIVIGRMVHESRHYLLLAEPEPVPQPEAEVPPELEGIRLLVGQRSDAGQMRELDEDSLFVLTLSPTYEARMAPVLGLFAVADGMGGHTGGEVASRMALEVLVERVMQTIILPELAGELVLEDDILALLRQATISANDAVYLARQKRENDMGTTLTTALIRNRRLFLAHVGDCRAYRWNADGLEQLTVDHSVIASMIANGQAKPEEVYTHPHRSIIYRCIGDKPVVEVDADTLPLAADDRIILCCDGLWEMIRDEGIEDVMMQEADPQAACDLLVRRANAAGGEDNISVVVIEVEAVPELED